MGMFADYRSVMKSTKQMSKDRDVKGDMANMQSKMSALNATMTTTISGRAMTEGIVASATVTSITPTGTMINFAPAFQIELLVMVPGRPPMPVSRTEAIPPLYLSRALPGEVVSVKVMPEDALDVFIDWAAG